MAVVVGSDLLVGDLLWLDGCERDFGAVFIGDVFDKSRIEVCAVFECGAEDDFFEECAL